MDYQYGSHTVFKIQYHFVFVTKYRYQVLKGDVGLKVRELIRQTFQSFEIETLKGVVSKDHVHLLVSAPPNMAPSEIMRRIKGRSSSKLFESFPDLQIGVLPENQLILAEPSILRLLGYKPIWIKYFKKLTLSHSIPNQLEDAGLRT
jgi:REP element-mobilizing transposase RayT